MRPAWFEGLEEFTPREAWLGGFVEPRTGDAVRSKDVLATAMAERGFELVHRSQMPALIREHQRKYQYIVSEATGWRKL